MTTRRWTVYLLHFSRPYKHARHYLGTTSDLDARVAEHLSGHGSPLVRAAVEAGIAVTVARTWKSGGRSRERRLKRSHNVPRLCPACYVARLSPTSVEAALVRDCGITQRGIVTAVSVYRALSPIFHGVPIGEVWDLSDVVARVARQLATEKSVPSTSQRSAG